MVYIEFMSPPKDISISNWPESSLHLQLGVPALSLKIPGDLFWGVEPEQGEIWGGKRSQQDIILQSSPSSKAAISSMEILEINGRSGRSPGITRKLTTIPLDPSHFSRHLSNTIWYSRAKATVRYNNNRDAFFLSALRLRLSPSATNDWSCLFPKD